MANKDVCMLHTNQQSLLLFHVKGILGTYYGVRSIRKAGSSVRPLRYPYEV